MRSCDLGLLPSRNSCETLSQLTTGGGCGLIGVRAVKYGKYKKYMCRGITKKFCQIKRTAGVVAYAAAARGLAQKLGARCDKVRGLMVCWDVPSVFWSKGYAGSVLGDTFFTPNDKKWVKSSDQKYLLRHEKEHVRQYKIYGVKNSLYLYFSVEGTNPCNNYFEEKANWAWGNYDECL